MNKVFAEKIIQHRLGGKVERCHAVPHNGSYSVAAHSWGVAMLMYYLFPADYPRLVTQCLTHDVPEAWFGDVPATVMRYVPGVRDGLGKLEGLLNRDMGLPAESELSEDDLAKLKACDRLELALWACEQLAMGNNFAVEPLRELTKFFDKSPLPEPAQEFWEVLSSGALQYKQAGVVEELVGRFKTDAE